MPDMHVQVGRVLFCLPFRLNPLARAQSSAWESAAAVHEALPRIPLAEPAMLAFLRQKPGN